MLKNEDVAQLIISKIPRLRRNLFDAPVESDAKASAEADIKTAVDSKESKDKNESLQASEIRDLAKIDYLHDNTVIQWFKNTILSDTESRVRTDKLTLEAQLRRAQDPNTVLNDTDYIHEERKILLDCVKHIYHAARTDEVFIIAKSRADAAILFVHFRTQFVIQLNRSELNANEFGNVLTPNNEFISSVLGMNYVPFDRDGLTAPSNAGNNQVPYNTTELSGGIELKMPAILLQHGPKTLKYILKRLETLGFSPDLFKEQTLNLREVLDFPSVDLPYDAETKELFDRSTKLQFLRQQDSGQFPGCMRILTDNLDAFKKGLMTMSRAPQLDPNFDPKVAAPTTLAESLELSMQQLLKLEVELPKQSTEQFQSNLKHILNQLLNCTDVPVASANQLANTLLKATDFAAYDKLVNELKALIKQPPEEQALISPQEAINDILTKHGFEPGAPGLAASLLALKPSFKEDEKSNSERVIQTLLRGSKVNQSLLQLMQDPKITLQKVSNALKGWALSAETNISAFSLDLLNILQNPNLFSQQIGQALSVHDKNSVREDADVNKLSRDLIQDLLRITKDNWARLKLEEFSVPQCAIGIEPMLFKELFISIQQKASKDSLPSYLRLGQPCLTDKEFVIPAEINLAPKMGQAASKTLTIIIQDVSGSMASDNVDVNENGGWMPEVPNERIVACKIALEDQLRKLSILNNQEVCLITLGSDSKVLIPQQPINPSNVEAHIATVKTLWANESTNIQPSLRAMVEQVKAARAKDPNINIQVLALTDGGFGDKNEAEIARIMAEVPKMPIRFIALFDINFRDPNLKPALKTFVQGVQEGITFVVKQGLTGPGQGQVVPTLTTEIRTTMDKLIIKTDSTVQKVKDVTLQYTPTEKVNLQVTKLPVMSSGIPQFRHLPCAPSTLDIFRDVYNAKDLKGNIVVTLEDGSKIPLEFSVPMDAFKKPLKPTEFNENHYYYQEWLPNQCLSRNLGDPVSLTFETLSTLYIEATQLGSEKLRRHLRKLMKTFIESFEKEKIQKSYPTKCLKLEALLKEMDELEARNNLIFIETLQPALKSLQKDPDIIIEKTLFNSAGVNTVAELDALPFNTLFSVYNGILELVRQNPGELNMAEGTDTRTVESGLALKRDLILIKLRLCEIAKQELSEQTINAFLGANPTANIAERLRVFQELIQVIERQIENRDCELLASIKAQVQNIALEGWFEQITKKAFNTRDNDGAENVSLVDQYCAFNTILNEKMVGSEFEGLRKTLIDRYLKPMWRNAELCIAAKVNSVNAFAELSNAQQMDAYKQVLNLLGADNERKEAAEGSSENGENSANIVVVNNPRTNLALSAADVKLSIQQTQNAINGIWLEYNLCKAAEVDSMDAFNKELPIDARVSVYAEVRGIAETESRPIFVSEINKRINSLKAESILLDAINKSGKAKSFKEFQVLEDSQREEIIKDAINNTPKDEKGVLANLQYDLELCSKMSDPMFIQTEVEKIIWSHCNDDKSITQLVSEDDIASASERGGLDPWAFKVKKLNGVLSILQANGPKPFADYLSKMIEADAIIWQRLGKLADEYHSGGATVRARVAKDCQEKGIQQEEHEEWIALQGFGKMSPNQREKYRRRGQPLPSSYQFFRNTFFSSQLRILRRMINEIMGDRKLDQLSEDELFLLQRINLRINNRLYMTLLEQTSELKKGTLLGEEKLRQQGNEKLLQEYAYRLCLLYMKKQLVLGGMEESDKDGSAACIEYAKQAITKYTGWDINNLPSIAEVRALERGDKAYNPDEADTKASVEREKVERKIAADAVATEGADTTPVASLQQQQPAVSDLVNTAQNASDLTQPVVVPTDISEDALNTPTPPLVFSTIGSALASATLSSTSVVSSVAAEAQQDEKQDEMEELLSKFSA